MPQARPGGLAGGLTGHISIFLAQPRFSLQFAKGFGFIKKMKLSSVSGQPSWALESDCVQAAVTRQGGHLGPVQFQFARRVVSPFHVAPWAEEQIGPGFPQILRVLRGDFFCLPFGGNGRTWRGEKHPAHGETANEAWTFDGLSREGGEEVLRLHLETHVRKAVVEKTIRLVTGHQAVYCRHIVRGASGPMNLGHHAMLRFPDSGGRISTSPTGFGQVYPGVFEKPEMGGYCALKAGARFRTLAKVPLAAGGTTDLTRYPARAGFEDLVMVSSRPGEDFAWTAVVFPGEKYVWFSLKDPRVLASTVLWHSNGGRHYPPWNGRHRQVLGLEEVTSHFHDGLAESSAKNAVSEAGIPTVLRLSRKKPLVVNIIMGVAEVPKGFETVRQITREAQGVLLHGNNSRIVRAPVDWGFLYRD